MQQFALLYGYLNLLAAVIVVVRSSLFFCLSVQCSCCFSPAKVSAFHPNFTKFFDQFSAISSQPFLGIVAFFYRGILNMQADHPFMRDDNEQL